MCQICQLTGCYAGCPDPACFSRQQAIPGILGGYLGQQQARQGFGHYRPPTEEEINKRHCNPKYPPTTAETYGEFGTVAQTDHDNRMAGRERNTKDMFQVRRFIEDRENKKRRAAYDEWIERRDL